ncbi:Ig-like domain-containing protein [Aquimarina sp. AU474]|uniref:Ig-like domain-containing protein n=1 Tax=Aquimarina sp. AU474 TaxID=2108529 RepID=UPI000D693F59|nr:Ig-like domain-containing protein [Aquimarina sp. AU474]
MKIITLLLFRKRDILLIYIFILFSSSSFLYGDSIYRLENTSSIIGNTTKFDERSNFTNPLSLTIIKVQDATTTGICCDGIAEAVASGGAGGYTYQWSASARNQTTITATGLTSETHSVTVTDANGAQITRSVTIQCLANCNLKASNTATNILCHGETTGAIDVTVSEGTPPYTFAWSNGATSEDINNLAVGTYSVTITDSNNCSIQQSNTITQPTNKVSITISSKDDIICNDLGTIIVSGTGGTPPYSYSINNGATYQNDDTFTNLSQGDHTVIIRDKNNCTSTVTTTILSNCTMAVDDTNTTLIDTPVSGNVLTNDEDLEGDIQTVTTTSITTNQGILVTINPNTGIYTYTPPSGFTGIDTFEYTVCDNGNPIACDTAIVTITIINCDLDAVTTVTNVSCNGEATGAIDLTVSNGTPPYTYTWSNGALSEDLNDLIAGTYSVTITDSNNCSIQRSNIITQPDDKVSVIITSTTDIICEGTGTIAVAGTGGTPPYSYSIDNGVTYQNNDIFTNIASGGHTITIRDANNCTSTITTEILSNCTLAIIDINNTFIDTPVSGNVLTNDEDLEGDTQTVTTLTVTTTQGVLVTIDPNTGVYTYTPPSGFVGEDTFEYTICDNGNPVACDTATVYIEVLPIRNPENNPPVANPDTAITEIDTPVNGNVLINDFDPDGDTIVVTTTTVTTIEGVIVNIDHITGLFTYTPPIGFTGEDSFEYTICDDGNPILCDTAIVTITVISNQGNNTFANDDAYFIACDNITGNVLDNDFDPEGDIQTVDTTPTVTTQNGTLLLNTNGTFTYTSNPGFIGTDSFVYTVCDDNSPSACDQATVYFTISNFTPPDLTNCNVTDETIECDGDNNETIADIWNADNISQLESCVTDICGNDYTSLITSNYNFDNLVSTCGESGSIEVTYTITNDSATTTVTVTLTLIDTTPPDLTNCEIEDLTLTCSVSNSEEIADQWNTNNVIALEICASDNCNSSSSSTVDSDYDFNNIVDGALLVEYTITDDCGNVSILNARINIENNSIATNDTSLCAVDEIESQVFDLFNLLEGDFNTNGIWEVVSGNAVVVDNNFFDPLSIELINEDDSETITFSYTIDDLVCPIYLEASIEVHNRCAVFTCGGDGDVKISKVITPNGDSFNEYFVVNGVEDCGYIIDVKILNRWGAIIYKSNDYQNDWNGTANRSSLGSANQIPSGTYYAIVTLNNSGLEPISSALYIGTK